MVVIFVDTRELQNNVCRKLFELGVELNPVMLKVADFVVSDVVGVERKTANDFASSIIDGRLFSQAEALKSSYEKPVIILEGDLKSVDRGVHINSLRGALCSLSVDYKIPVIQTSSSEETAEVLLTLAKREQELKKRSIILRGERRPNHIKELQEYLITSFPGIGPEVAKSILKHFTSPLRFFQAGEKELLKVQGIGKKRAEEIIKVLNTEYRWQ